MFVPQKISYYLLLMCATLLQFWAAYVPCDSQYKDAVQLTLEQIDVIRRLTELYHPSLTLCTSAEGAATFLFPLGFIFFLLLFLHFNIKLIESTKIWLLIHFFSFENKTAKSVEMNYSLPSLCNQRSDFFFLSFLFLIMSINLKRQYLNQISVVLFFLKRTFIPLNTNESNAFEENKSLARSKWHFSRTTPKWPSLNGPKCYFSASPFFEGKTNFLIVICCFYVSCMLSAFVLFLTLRIINFVMKYYLTNFPHLLWFIIFTFTDIKAAYGRHQLCSLIGVEGGHSLAGSLAVLRTLYHVGVRYLTLTSTCNTPW